MNTPAIPHILILGGTADARALASLIHRKFRDGIRLTTSLAGRTKSPAGLAGVVRTGGFGGVPGLIEYVRAEDVSALIDATHPFAANISAHAHDVAEKTGIARLMIKRPRWPLPEALDVRRVTDMAAAAQQLAKTTSQRVLLTTGTQNLEAFADIPDTWFLVRQIENHEASLPMSNADTVIQKPPFTLESEKALMIEYAVDTLVTKESGGRATEAKLAAAAELGIRTVMIERPEMPAGDHVSSPEEALVWLQGCLGLNT